MKTFSILNGFHSYTINVNKSRRTFTFVYNHYDRSSGRWYRLCKDKCFPLTSNRFDLYLIAFDRFEKDFSEASQHYDFFHLMAIFPLFRESFF